MIEFEKRNLKPMLIGASSEPFDSKDYIFELKLDGERCLAYLDKTSTELRNKRNMRMLPKVPELSELHKHVRKPCILDGELIVAVNGKPDFFQIQRRSLMGNSFKIDLASKQYPASFVAFDILWYDGEDVTGKPLMERKKLLGRTVKSEGDRFALSRYVEEKGTTFFTLSKEQELEGIVAKQKDSKYHPDKRTKEWLKIKNLQDDDFIICGYIHKENNMTSLVLGQYRDGKMVYKGHVTLGVSGDSFRMITFLKKLDEPPMEVPAGNEKAVWVSPELVCTVKYLMLTDRGTIRQPVFKGLRKDKRPEDCVIK